MTKKKDLKTNQPPLDENLKAIELSNDSLEESSLAILNKKDNKKSNKKLIEKLSPRRNKLKNLIKK
tara:strand:+ start:557 stop:754 length:198 start_codon:yes stop_codon:yes gene_type:complete